MDNPEDKDLSREEIFNCGCHEHKLEIYTCDMKGGVYDFTISAWQQGYGCHQWSFWDRVKILFGFLLNGEWTYDWVLLEPDEAKRLGKYLLDECERIENARR